MGCELLLDSERRNTGLQSSKPPVSERRSASICRVHHSSEGSVQDQLSFSSVALTPDKTHELNKTHLLRTEWRRRTIYAN